MSVLANLGNMVIWMDWREKSCCRFWIKSRNFQADNSWSCTVSQGRWMGVGSVAAAWAAPDRPFLLQAPARQGDANGARKSLFRYQHFHRDQPMKAYNPPSRIGRAACSVQGGHGMEPRPMERFCFATIIVATLTLHGFEPLPCRAQTPAPAPLPSALPRQPIPPPRRRATSGP